MIVHLMKNFQIKYQKHDPSNDKLINQTLEKIKFFFAKFSVSGMKRQKVIWNKTLQNTPDFVIAYSLYSEYIMSL